MDVRKEELVDSDNAVQLNLVRRKGASSRVVLRWKATGEHNGIYDMNPVEGMVSGALWCLFIHPWERILLNRSVLTLINHATVVLEYFRAYCR